MPRARREVTIGRPVDEVFAFVADAENDPKWRGPVLDVKRVAGDAPGLGARYRQGVKGPFGRRTPADTEVTAFEPGRKLAFRVTAGPVRPEPSSSGTGRIAPARASPLNVHHSTKEAGTMKRLLVPGLIAGMAALVVGGAAAGAHSGAGAHAAKGETITLMRVGKLGKILTDGEGHVVYLFEKDRHGKSACYGPCATQWPPVITRGKPIARGGASASKLGTTRRRNGKTQVTYNGHPIYYYEFDNNKPRRANGEGSKAFGAEWYVLNARGRKVEGGGS